MNYEDVTTYVQMMEYPITLIPLANSYLNKISKAFQLTAPFSMEYVMKVVDRYNYLFDHEFKMIEDEVYDALGFAIQTSVFNFIDSHHWGVDKTDKITGMLLDYIMRDGQAHIDRRLTAIDGNLHSWVEEAFFELH